MVTVADDRVGVHRAGSPSTKGETGADPDSSPEPSASESAPTPS